MCPPPIEATLLTQAPSRHDIREGGSLPQASLLTAGLSASPKSLGFVSQPLLFLKMWLHPQYLCSHAVHTAWGGGIIFNSQNSVFASCIRSRPTFPFLLKFLRSTYCHSNMMAVTVNTSRKECLKTTQVLLYRSGPEYVLSLRR